MKKISFDKLSKLVIAKRNELNLSQGDLGEKTGINRQLIGRIESGKFIPSINQLELLLKELNIELDDIMEDEIEENVFLAMRGKAESYEEKEGLDKMISMMLCLRKHKNLRRALR
ncbi:MAG: helix-turn-helix transcriptional regulator [Romboutsia sp.]